MGAVKEGNGLSLEGLAHRLETLERENAELRGKVATLEGFDTSRAVEEQEPASSSEKRRVSRSWLLRNAGAAAVGTMAAGALLARDASVAKADHFAPGISVDYVITHLETADLTAVFGNAPNGEGVVGFGKTNGVRGEGGIGVIGKSSAIQGYGVVGVGEGSDASGGVLGRVSATNNRGIGVVGVGRTGMSGEGVTLQEGTPTTGVHGKGDTGVAGLGSATGVLGNGKVGVHGIGDTGHGVFGQGNGIDETAGVRGTGKTGVWGSTGVTGYSGVYGQHTGSFGYGLVGDGRGSSGAGVLGRNNNSSGVRGEGVNGVHGKATSGYGALFEGGKAQLKIVPKGSVGKPTSGAHTKGEVYMDSAGTLFVCTANGTPGTWRKVTTTAA